MFVLSIIASLQEGIRQIWDAVNQKLISPINREAEELRRTNTGLGDGFTTLYVVIVAAFCLTISDLKYLGGETSAHIFFNFIDNARSPEEYPILWALVGWIKPESGLIRASKYFELWNLAHWTFVKVLAYLIIPTIAIWANPKLRFRDMGLSTKGFVSHLWIYVALFLPVLVMVIGVSFTDEFSTYYPFYQLSMRSPFDFWAWEFLYILQFFSLEFFFRGFLLQPLKRSMGASAVLAMMLPYVMIHYGKPFAECMGAIFAGIILGVLALRTRSIWAGFLIHVSVALSMDIVSNLQKGGLDWLKSLF